MTLFSILMGNHAPEGSQNNFSDTYMNTHTAKHTLSDMILWNANICFLCFQKIAFYEPIAMKNNIIMNLSLQLVVIAATAALSQSNTIHHPEKKKVPLRKRKTSSMPFRTGERGQGSHLMILMFILSLLSCQTNVMGFELNRRMNVVVHTFNHKSAFLSTRSSRKSKEFPRCKHSCSIIVPVVGDASLANGWKCKMLQECNPIDTRLMYKNREYEDDSSEEVSSRSRGIQDKGEKIVTETKDERNNDDDNSTTASERNSLHSHTMTNPKVQTKTTVITRVLHSSSSSTKHGHELKKNVHVVKTLKDYQEKIKEYHDDHLIVVRFYSLWCKVCIHVLVLLTFQKL